MVWIIVAIILYRQVVPLGRLIRDFPLNDFSVYLDGTRTTLVGKNPYRLKFFDRYNYPPAATFVFLTLVKLPTEVSEWIFTLVSVLSLWLSVSWTMNILEWNPKRSVKWLIFALSLKLFPVKLTLALGQINLIILMLLVGSFYFAEVRKKQTASGLLFGLAAVLKLTPAPSVIYFLIKRKWRLIGWAGVAAGFLTVGGGLAFGWDLTKYYFATVLPRLMNEVTKETVNASYMNQSVTALLARMGIFGNVNVLIRLIVSGGLFLVIAKNAKISEKRERFIFFWEIVIISTLFLPVFVWQHHYVFLLPAWLLLASVAFRRPQGKLILLAIGSYFLIDFYIRDPYLPVRLHPVLATHFLISGLFIMALLFIKTSLLSIKQK